MLFDFFKIVVCGDFFAECGPQASFLKRKTNKGSRLLIYAIMNFRVDFGKSIKINLK